MRRKALTTTRSTWPDQPVDLSVTVHQRGSQPEMTPDRARRPRQAPGAPALMTPLAPLTFLALIVSGCASTVSVRELATGRVDVSAYELHGSSARELEEAAARLCPNGGDVLRRGMRADGLYAPAAPVRAEANRPIDAAWWRQQFDRAERMVAPAQGQAQMMVRCDPESGQRIAAAPQRIGARPGMPVEAAPAQSVAMAKAAASQPVAEPAPVVVASAVQAGAASAAAQADAKAEPAAQADRKAEAAGEPKSTFGLKSLLSRLWPSSGTAERVADAHGGNGKSSSSSSSNNSVAKADAEPPRGTAAAKSASTPPATEAAARAAEANASASAARSAERPPRDRPYPVLGY